MAEAAAGRARDPLADVTPARLPDLQHPGPRLAHDESPDHEVCIVGAGIAGLGMAIRLREAGIDSFVIVEQADAVGGTWRDNAYPGCACDIPSPLYSLSFAPKTDWSRLYPTQPEIRAYLESLVRDFDLAPRLWLSTRLDEAQFDEAAGLWRLRAGARAFSARFIVGAFGALSRPALPALPGLERFAGPAFHSARWNASLELAGRRVAIIGTGASAIQLVPQIAPAVAQLDVYQRSAAWVLPKLDRAIGAREQRLLARLPLWRRLGRWLVYWRQEVLALGFTVDVRLLERARRMGLKMLRRQVASDELRARLTPHYIAGCKRILISNDYYPAFARPNVALVSEPIREVTAHAIVTADGVERAADVIVFATGFRVTEPLAPLRIAGRGGRLLDDAWRDGMHAYLGLAVPGFPNLFLLAGPNTGLGHNSVVFMFEAQIGHVIACLRALRERGQRTIEVRAQVEADFNDEVQRRLRRTVWATGCTSWYQDARGRNVTLWPGFSVDYWRRLRRVDWRAWRTQGPPGGAAGRYPLESGA